MSNIIQQLEQEQMSRELPEFAPGDTEDKLFELLRHIVTEVKATA